MSVAPLEVHVFYYNYFLLIENSENSNNYLLTFYRHLSFKDNKI